MSFRFEDLGESPTAVVIAVQQQGVSDGEHASSLEELERLAKTLGLVPVGRITQRRAKLAPGKVFGDGKLLELAKWTGGTGEIAAYVKPGSRKDREQNADDDDDDDGDADLHEDVETDAEAEADVDADAEVETESVDAHASADADTAPAAEPTDEASAEPAPTNPPPKEPVKVVLVDHELSPTQQRNLEKATGIDVLDRTSVILEIFHRHARTREARLQVEIARLKYLAPRLRESGGGGDRVRGGVGGKGAGESSLELDRRRIRDRIAELRGELAQIEGGASTRRARRSELPTVALVGYTNAGKSSLMRALTGSEVYVADKLFATLDTTVRAIHPRTEPPILASDTVGFIKKLPHDLVASFRSTLDEANEADLLLHVVDAADPAMRAQREVTREVLAEIKADQVPTLLVLNKIDRVDADGRAALAAEFPDAVQLSSKDPADVARLRERLIEQFAGAMEEAEFVVPWAQHKIVAALHQRAKVLTEAHTDLGTVVTARAPKSVLASIRAELEAVTAD